MLYTVTNRIIYGRKVVGYRVVDSNDNIYNISKSKACRLAANILITNASYNRRNESLTGVSGVNLTKMKSIESTEIKESDDDKIEEFKELNIKQLISKYEAKRKALGINTQFHFVEMENSRVNLNGMSGSWGDTVVIPSFVTDFGSAGPYGQYIAPFGGMAIRNLYIDNRADRGLRCFRLLSDTTSKHITVEFAHPENILDMSYMFAGCYLLESIEFIGDTNTINLLSIAGIFSKCPRLKSIEFNGLNTSKVINAKSAFEVCTELVDLDLSKLDFSNLKMTTKMFSDNTSLEKVVFSKSSNALIEESQDMFKGCENLKHCDFGGLTFKYKETIPSRLYT